MKKLFLWLGVVLMVFPFVIMLWAGFLPQTTLLQSPQQWLGAAWSLENYHRLFAALPLLRLVGNSVLVACLTTVGQLGVATLAAFAFGHGRFRGQAFLFTLLVATMMIPPQVNLVPLFLVVKQLGWIDTIAGLVVPGCFGAYGVFLLRQWFLKLPKELVEAAALDGCTPRQLFWHVALPTIRPALAALAILTFLGSWNNLIWPLVVAQSETLQTLPLGLAMLKSRYRDAIDWGVMMAAATVAVLPMIGLYLALQRHFLAGLLEGGVKE